MHQQRENSFRNRVNYLNRFFLILFVLMGLGLLYWGTVRSPFLAEQADNPRNVERELRIQRGKIYDSSERLLVTNDIDRESGRVSRTYLERSAASITGYYSLRFGVSGIEGEFDELLRGTTTSSTDIFLTDVVGYPQIGDSIRLTIDLELQDFITSQLLGKKGAAILVSTEDNVVRALISAPSFDPSQIETNFDAYIEDENAPLLNRATQNFYQPGEILVPLWAAYAIQEDLVSTDLLEELPPGLLLDELTRRYDSISLRDAIDYFRLDAQIPFSLETGLLDEVEISDKRAEIRGEGALLVTPLHVVNAVNGLIQGGTFDRIELVGATLSSNEGAQWTAFSAPNNGTEEGPEEGAAFQNFGSDEIEVTTIDQLLPLFERGDNTMYRISQVESGPDSVNSWFLGYTPATSPRFLVVIVLEEEIDQQALEIMGNAILRQVFE